MAATTDTAMLLALVESMPDFVVRIDLDGTIRYMNRVIPELTLEQVIGTSVFDWADPADHEVMRATFARVAASGEPGQYEIRARGACGPATHYLSRVGAVRADDQVVGLTIVATDVSAVKATSRALAERQEMLDLAVAAAGLGFWTWDASDDRVVWDEGACRAFGVAYSDVRRTSSDFLARVHPRDRERVARALREALTSRNNPAFELRAVTPAGEDRWLLAAGAAERDERGLVRRLHGCVLDVTERRRLEEQLQQARRMEAVGQLAAGVAHNFNNFLAAVLPAVELAVKRAPEVAPILEDVRVASERAADVVRQLMVFAGRAPAAARAAVREDVGSVVRRTVHLARSVIDRRIAIDVDVPPEPRYAAIEPGQLEQAVLNLVHNARDALAAPGAGARPHPRIHIVVDDDGPDVRLQVRDDGCGMDEALRRRAIEPFFTTKPAGQGTGLGLSSVYATMHDHGGDLHIESALGVGTTVTLRLPRVEGDPCAAAAERAPAGTAARGEHILLVDDEHSVRRAVANVLLDEGYVVEDFANPERALERFRAESRRFDLVILDESMPECAGSALLREMHVLAPDLPAIAFSGLDHPIDGARELLVKPVSSRDLLSAVRRVLDAR